MPTLKGLFKSIADLFRSHDAHDKLEKGPAGEYEDFLIKGKAYADFSSSNVELMQYDYEAEKLYVQFKGGAVYGYHPVTMKEALGFAQAPSKGKEVWNVLRVRGTKLGHRKSYALERLH